MRVKLQVNYTALGLKIQGISARAFGKLNNRYGYQGDYSELDDESLYNEFALRSYDPQIGKFIQPDPYNQFASSYIGMGNDAVNNIDPNGGWIFSAIPFIERGIWTVAGAVTGTLIAGATSGWDANAMKNGAAIGAGVGLGASFVNWNTVGGALGNAGRWVGSNVGNLFQQNPTLFLEFIGKAYNYEVEKGKVRQYGIGDLILRDDKSNDIERYKAVSGPGTNGLIPDSEGDGYDYKRPEITPLNAPNRFLYETNDKFSFKMRMVKDRVGSRSALLIHPTMQFKNPLKNKYDPNAESLLGVTDGCIGLCGGPEEAHGFYERMIQYFKLGKKSIKVKVKIEGNKNVKIQLK